MVALITGHPDRCLFPFLQSRVPVHPPYAATSSVSPDPSLGSRRQRTDTLESV